MRKLINRRSNVRSFENIAILIRTKRLKHPLNLSQMDLSLRIGYKNGQFISNIERGQCNIPLEMMKEISEILDISSEEMKIAILKDIEVTLTNFFNKPLADLNKKDKKLAMSEIVY